MTVKPPQRKLIKSPLRYPGGKSRALRQILPLVPEFDAYREPLVGGGSVFLSLKQHVPEASFWINDLSYDLMCFWEMAQTNLTPLVDAVTDIYEHAYDGRELHQRYVQQADGLGKLEYAVRFFVLNRITFSGTVDAGGYSQSAFERRFTQSSVHRLARLADVLVGARISHGDYQAVLEEPVQHSGENVFIFLDPPYYRTSGSRLYGKKGVLHTSFDHEQLAETLKTCPHNWLMTYDDCPEIRELYAFANVQAWQLQYGMNNYKQVSAAKGREVFVANYDLEQVRQYNHQHNRASHK
ncbi:MAG: DNA adenine methylase [Deinococcota bacterium]